MAADGVEDVFPERLREELPRIRCESQDVVGKIFGDRIDSYGNVHEIEWNIKITRVVIESRL